MPDDTIAIEHDATRNGVTIRGPLDLSHYQQAKKQLERAFAKADGAPEIDAGGITRLDTAGALLLKSFLTTAGKNAAAISPRLINMRPEQQALYAMVAGVDTGAPMPPPPPRTTRQVVKNIGKASEGIAQATGELVAFMGQAALALGRVALRPSHLRLNSISHHVEQVGINAIPIIGLISFLMAIILAYQGLAQLRPLGAEQYTVNLIAISVLREMSVLLASIMVAGRSGSAFTAEIGVMKEREEIDALRTIGFDPFEILVVPRLLAVLIALPLLTFIADLTGLLGGALISLSLMHLSVTEYLDHVRYVVHERDFIVGLLKAPVFAFFIGLVGCMHGMKVAGSSESVGRETTASVVQSIFLVLLLDGFFSIFFQKVGL